MTAAPDDSLPEGWIPLGQLIECLMACLDEPGVDESSPVRIEPEFGRAPEPMFASGAAACYPSGQDGTSTRPLAVVEYRRGKTPPEVASLQVFLLTL